MIAYTRPRFGRRVVAVKGVAGNRPAIKASETKGSRLFIVGVDGVKGHLASRLSRGRSIRFSDRLEPRFYEELASERLIVRYIRGAPVRRWERSPGRRAECLDATVYAWAARGLLTLDLNRREAELAVQPAPPGLPAVIRSAWLDR
ncbi:MAG: phage terminase large subunit family protein [Bauldia sp.]|nr:phage terminase large subunit family protein [Bauldia sp.]